MNKKIFLIAGTEDGRKLAEFLSEKNFDVTASVVSGNVTLHPAGVLLTNRRAESYGKF